MVHLVHEPLTVEIRAAGHDRHAPWRDLRFEHRVPVLPGELAARHGARSAGLVALDTGSSASVVLHEQVARQLGLGPGTGRRGVRGVAGERTVGVRRLSWIDVGGARFERVRALVADFEEGALASPTTLGSVGWPLFAGRGLLLDWPRRRIAMLPSRRD